MVCGIMTKEGRCCYYCLRVFRAQFSHIYKMEALVVSMGKDQNLHQQFHSSRAKVVHRVLEAGRRDVRISWRDESQSQQEDRDEGSVLKSTSDKSIEMIEPEDTLFDPSDYLLKYGDIQSNGLGHKLVTIDGVAGVLVPGPKVWRIRRNKSMEAAIETVVDDGSCIIESDQMETKQQELMDAFMPCRGTGERLSLDFLLGSGSSSSGVKPVPVPGPGPKPTPAAAQVALGFSVSVQDNTRTVPPLADDVPKKRGGAKAKASPKEVGARAAGQPQTGASPSQRKGQGTTPNRGRPKRDLMACCNKVATEFSELEPDSDYFFAENKESNIRYMTRLVKDIKDQIAHTQDVDEVHLMMREKNVSKLLWT